MYTKFHAKKWNKSRIFALDERNLNEFALCLRYFCMRIHVFQPIKLLYASWYETYLSILAHDKRYNTPCFSAPWLDLAQGSGRVGSLYYSRLRLERFAK